MAHVRTGTLGGVATYIRTGERVATYVITDVFLPPDFYTSLKIYTTLPAGRFVCGGNPGHGTAFLVRTPLLVRATLRNKFWNQESPECDWRDPRQTGRLRTPPELKQENQSKFQVSSSFSRSRMHVRHSRDVLSVGITNTMSETSVLVRAAHRNAFWSQESPECDRGDSR